jgi:hypothetical protein
MLLLNKFHKFSSESSVKWAATKCCSILSTTDGHPGFWYFGLLFQNSWTCFQGSIKFINLFIYFGTGSHYIAQAGFKLSILWLQPPECWDYRHAPPCLAFKFISHRLRSRTAVLCYMCRFHSIAWGQLGLLKGTLNF